MQGLERIAKLASEIKDSALLKVIDYLLSRKDMNDKYLNEEKSLKQMTDFIKEQARKEAKNGMAMIEDVKVYGWAIHYFDESNENLKLSTSNNKNKEDDTSEDENDETIEISEKIDTKKVKQHKSCTPEGQLTLF